MVRHRDLTPWLIKAASRSTLAFLGIGSWILGCTEPAHEPLRHEFYIWRQTWTEETDSSLGKASARGTRFHVFAGEAFRGSNAEVEFQACSVDWEALRQAGQPVVLVFRLNDDFAPIFERAETAEGFARSFHAFVRQVAEPAKQAQLVIDGIELDYDCPTSRLKGYIRLVKALRAANTGMRIGITTLPDWTRSPVLRDLIGAVDSFVFQVHSVRRPTSPEEVPGICDVEKADDWLRQLDSVRTPFLIALPTYGCRIAFDASGGYQGLANSQLAKTPPPGWRIATSASDPARIAGLVRNLNAARPEYCKGIVWFRLPTEPDPLNWSWEGLSAVMQGRAPTVLLSAEAVQPKPGDPDLWEILVWSEGEHVPLDARIRVCPDFGDREVLASDGWNEFVLLETTLIGPAPRGREPVRAGWFRLRPTESGSIISLPKIKVEVLP